MDTDMELELMDLMMDVIFTSRPLALPTDTAIELELMDLMMEATLRPRRRVAT
jgi:NTP pyrophosphatase (non-canonical NTP hydrolase)